MPGSAVWLYMTLGICLTEENIAKCSSIFLPFMVFSLTQKVKRRHRPEITLVA